MAERIARLKQKQIEHARPPKGRRAVWIADGGNLYLQATVAKSGAINRSWVFRYEMDGERHEIGLGPLHTLGSGDARERALGFGNRSKQASTRWKASARPRPRGWQRRRDSRKPSRSSNAPRCTSTFMPTVGQTISTGRNGVRRSELTPTRLSAI